MKERILTKWTFTRVLFLAIGSYVIVQSILDNQWFGVVMGSYFASMGLFAFGCASGNCFNGTCAESQQKLNKTVQDVDFEEVKTK